MCYLSNQHFLTDVIIIIIIDCNEFLLLMKMFSFPRKLCWHIYIYIYMYTMDYNSAIRKGYLAICNSMDGLRALGQVK